MQQDKTARKQPRQAAAQAPDLLETTLRFAVINMPWIFFTLWLLYGMVPVLLLATLINHMITRLEMRP
ncbi:histidinol phosphate aminotransferase [Phaeobacter sp. CAU 1743]|uniref:histidinol phosphate aminotransferase n=1 Tax=Phaeobacter sp. CAU 1743 TaxID=3140367 RepID=UPI0023B54F86